MALIFDRRELALGEVIQRPRGDHHEQCGHDDGRAHLERAVQESRVRPLHGFERVVHQLGQPAFLAFRMHEARAHHRRQRNRDDAGHDDRGGERDGELEKQ